MVKMDLLELNNYNYYPLKEILIKYNFIIIKKKKKIYNFV